MRNALLIAIVRRRSSVVAAPGRCPAARPIRRPYCTTTRRTPRRDLYHCAREMSYFLYHPLSLLYIRLPGNFWFNNTSSDTTAQSYGLYFNNFPHELRSAGFSLRAGRQAKACTPSDLV